MLFNISNAEIGERGLIKYGDTEIKDWQKALFTDIYASNIEIPGMKKIVSPFTLYFYPNRPATRAEVFEFSRNIINQNTKNFDNTEISFQLPLGWITKYEDFGHIKSYNFTNYNDACTVSYCPEGYRAFFLSVYKNDNRDNFFEKYQHDKKLYTEKEELDLGNNNKIEIFTLNKKSSTEDETWDMVLPVSSAFME
jgi:hypothetical protein